MANADFITDRIAVGGSLSTRPGDALADLGELVAAGITHILDTRREWSDEAFVARHAPALRYLHLGVEDHGARMPDAWYDAGVTFAGDAMTKPFTAVLVHCHMGVNRGPSMAFAILLSLGWRPVAALDAIRRARPIAAARYAEHALDWHHRRRAQLEGTRNRDRHDVANWRAANPLDTARIVRRLRSACA